MIKRLKKCGNHREGLLRPGSSQYNLREADKQVSKSLQSAAESDSVWERFLPSDYQSIISASLTPVPDFVSKKDLYVYLCRHPLLIDSGHKVEEILVDIPQYWEWTSLPESRFPEVAKLKRIWSVDIGGTIRARVLSPRKSYAAYLVYNLVPEGEESIYNLPCDLQDELKKVYEVLSNLPSDAEDDDPGIRDDIYLALQYLPENVSNRLQLIMRRPKLRDDGWFEIELGEFYTENEDDRIEMNLKECASLKTGLIF
ncbi:hypothetical protein KY290_005349 [Solanum tuberosum]|uniref:F-box family protein n=1 Tax=Solanum tuberosum TaxID=4113 RepID=A0ABQ7WGD0_SOLTU|nr:hypothetical protein KY289_005742 [Solanum tuberosum]KAH0778922.1 hypothetical protein KY290_005349 [Solanum tuberosum]